jgi:hypothetical protein
MIRSQPPIDVSALEEELRAALRARASSTPVSNPTSGPPPADVGHPTWSPARRRLVLSGAVAAAAAVVGAVAVVGTAAVDGPDAETTDAGLAAPGLPAAEVPRLVIEGARFQPTSDEGAAPVRVDTDKVTQVFRDAERLDGPMIFLTTLLPHDEATFGLVDEDTGEPVDVRGRTGFIDPPSGDKEATRLSVELGDGSAIYAIAIGMTGDELVAFVDGLEPAPRGRWAATAAPPGVEETTVAPAPRDGRHYSGRFVLPGVTDVEVALYQDGFEDRLADRVNATDRPVEEAAVDGHPAALGAYGDTDWWVLLEPEPGRAVEIRINGDRAAVDRVLSRARFVDEVTWDALTEPA